MPTKEANDKGQVLELTLAQAATIAGVTPRTITNWLDQPYPPPRNSRKKFPSDMFGEWLRDRVKRETERLMAAQLQMPDGRKRFDEKQEAARKNAAMADKTELELAVRRGELIEAFEVERAWSAILNRVRSRLTSLPTSAAPLVIGIDEQARVQKILRDMVRDALLELSGDWREIDVEQHAEGME